jgi:hypothetical protein
MVQRFFGHVCVWELLIAAFAAPFFLLVIILFFRAPYETAKLAYSYSIVSFALSILAALEFFVIVELIISETWIWPSLKDAWPLFIRHFPVLAPTGIILAILGYLISLVVGALTILAQNGHNLGELTRLDLLAPHLPFVGNGVYQWAIVAVDAIMRSFKISVFVWAYSMYRDGKAKKRGNSHL